MLAAILCSSLVMTSCSNDDNAITAESAEMAKALEGEWIGEIKVDEFMLEAAVKRDMTAEKPAWVINYPSAYLIPFSDSYREVAASTNQKAIDWLGNHKGSVGIIYMDFAGMDESPDYAAAKLYNTVGMKLVNAVINQNWKE